MEDILDYQGEEEHQESENQQEDYGRYFNRPSLLLRMKSMMIDSLAIIALMYLASVLLNSFEVESGKTRGIFLGLIFLYEPILVTLGSTIGQKIMGLKVRKYSRFLKGNEKRNLNIIDSLMRYSCKLLLGWVSLLTVHSDQYGQAIHDKFGDSVMVIE